MWIALRVWLVLYNPAGFEREVKRRKKPKWPGTGPFVCREIRKQEIWNRPRIQSPTETMGWVGEVPKKKVIGRKAAKTAVV